MSSRNRVGNPWGAESLHYVRIVDDLAAGYGAIYPPKKSPALADQTKREWCVAESRISRILLAREFSVKGF
jgi:hypothetical protein